MTPRRTQTNVSRQKLKESQLWWETWSAFEEREGCQLALCLFLKHADVCEKTNVSSALWKSVETLEAWAIGKTTATPRHPDDVVMQVVHDGFLGWSIRHINWFDVKKRCP